MEFQFLIRTTKIVWFQTRNEFIIRIEQFEEGHKSNPSSENLVRLTVTGKYYQLKLLSAHS